MIKKFNEFDVNDYLGMKHLNEDVKVEDEFEKDRPQAVYENPYLDKISNIVLRKLKTANLGNFGIYHDVIYMDGMPGFWVYGIDNKSLNIVCFRDTNEKKISIFDTFEINAENTARVTYSTTTLGFKNMLDKVIEDLQGGELNEAFGSYQWDIKHIDKFKDFDSLDLVYLINLYKQGSDNVTGQKIYDNYINGDKDAVRIFGRFSSKPSPSDGRKLMNITRIFINYIQNGGHSNDKRTPKEIDDLLNTGNYNDVIDKFKDLGVKSSGITVSSGGSVGVSDSADGVDASKLREEMKKKEQEKNDALFAEFQTNMQLFDETLSSYCEKTKYNKKTGRTAVRCLVLSGTGGFGKSYALNQVMKKYKMVQNEDYYVFTSASSTADIMYKKFYKYNDKIVVFDDTPKIFSEEYRVSMWKNSLELRGTPKEVGYPRSIPRTGDIYDLDAINYDRYRRYFKEIGKLTDDEKNDFYESQIKKYFGARRLEELWDSGKCDWKEGYKGKLKDYNDPDQEQKNEDAVAEIDDGWKTRVKEVQPKIPSSFEFKGYIVILTNQPESEIINAMGGQANYDAVKSRLLFLTADAPYQSFWEGLRKQILAEADDESIPDEKKLIQGFMAKEFVEAVDDYVFNKGTSVTRRLVSIFHDRFSDPKTMGNWRDYLDRHIGKQQSYNGR